MTRLIVRRSSSSAARLLPRLISALTRTWVLALLWLAVLVYASRFAIFKLPAPPNFTDFNHYYTATLALRRGSNPYLTSYGALGRSLGLELSGLDTENQPPTLFLCFAPLTRLGPYSAYWVWVAISLAALVIAVWVLVGETSLDTRQTLLFGALLFLYPPIYEHFYFANMQIAITLLIVVALHCMACGADRRAGLLLALATALKAYPALLAIYLACRGRWQALRWMTIWGGVIGLLTLWDVGSASFSFLKTFGYTTARHFIETPAFFRLTLWCRACSGTGRRH
jgi:Glycosyltransferase family 87